MGITDQGKWHFYNSIKLLHKNIIQNVTRNRNHIINNEK